MDEDVRVRNLAAEDAQREAVAAAYRSEGPKIWRSLVAYSGSREIASDALAEATAQALAKHTSPDDPARWLWAVAFRVASGELKRRGRETTLPEGSTVMPEPAVDLIRALATLSPNQRAALILHAYAGYRPREIAEILGSSAATVRVHMSKGRARLRKAMEVDDG